MITLLIQNITKDDDTFYNIECEHDATVEDLKCLIAVESGLDIEVQLLQFRQSMLSDDNKKLTDYGITNNDMLNLHKKQPQPQVS
jgi:uncharacterized ubiquitin-like protein YukD